MMEPNFNPNSAACGQWETYFTEALDGLLRPEDEAAFSAHLALCPSCAALYEEARQGREWLGFLAQEPEVPAGLLDRILAETGPGRAAGCTSIAGGDVVPAPSTPIPAFITARHRTEPRLLMTVAMAFFSITLTLNVAGVRLSNLRASELRVNELRPAALLSFMERRLTTASTPIIRYYDHSRLVYEVESRVRELRRTTQAAEDEETPQKPKDGSPGEAKETPSRKAGGPHLVLPKQDPPQQSTDLATGPERDNSNIAWPAHPSGRRTALQDRSTAWIA